MATLVRNFSTFVVSGGWTNEDRALNDGAPGYAHSNDAVATLVFYGPDLSSLPASITVDGISIRLDASKDETSGSGTLQVGAELTWNSGTGYTTEKATSNLTTTEAIYTLGGATDTWGRTWTRAELQANVFRIRLSCNGSGIVDAPHWRVEYVQVTIHYTDTTTLALTWTETLQLSEPAFTASRLQLFWDETLTLRDSAPGLYAAPPDAMFGGDVLDEIQSPPATFLTASAQHNAPSGLVAEITLTGVNNPAKTFFVGEPAVTGPGTTAQTGFVELADLTIEAAPAVPGTTPEVEFAIVNRPMGTGTSTTDWLGNFVRASFMLGNAGAVTLRAHVLEGATWVSKVLFSGVIVSYEVTPEVVRFRCADVLNTLVEIPKLSVHATAMQYSADEGKMPDEFNGAVIPIAIGRFNATALAVWPSGHPMEANTSEQLYIWLAPLMGMKIPMLPLIPVADNYRRISGSTAAATLKHIMFAFGDKVAAPLIYMQPTVPGTKRHLPSLSGSFADPVLRLFYNWAFTWNRELDRAESLIADTSSDINSTERAMVGSGPYDDLVGNFTGASYPLSKAQGVFINKTNPQFATTETTWPGVLQSVFIPATGLTEILVGTFNDGTPIGTTVGTLNPLDAIDADPSTYATVPSGNRLALQCRRSLSSLGDIYMLRLVVAMDTGSAATVRYALRYANSPINFTVEPSHAIVKPDNLATASGEQAQATNVRYSIGYLWGIGKGSSSYGNWPQWQFHTRANPPISGANLDQAWDMQVWCTSGTARVVGMWLEAVYRSRISGSLLGNLAGSSRTIVGRERINVSTGQSLPRYSRAQQLAPVGQDEREREQFPQVFATCHRTVVDDSSGTYTGTPDATVENPADIVGLLLARYTTEFAARAVGTAFGSFARARTMLNAKISGDTFRHSVVVDTKRSLREVIDEIQDQSMSMFVRMINASGVTQWQAFVDSPAPHTDAPERLYRSTGGLFLWRDVLFAERTRVIPTPLDAIATSFLLQYGYHLPTGTYAYRKYISSTSDNLESNGGAYRGYCGFAEFKYSISRQFTVNAPWVWSHKVADALVKWHCDMRRQILLTIEFYLPLAYLDLACGHVIRFDDTFADFIKYPGENGATTWSTHYWNVISVTIMKEQDQPIMLRVLAREVYVAAA